jgi:hypothetical protein
MEKAKLVELKKIMEEADKFHAASMDDNAAEDEMDQAYAEYWKLADNAAELLKDLLKIDDLTAKRMVHHKKAEIIALINRME